MAARIPIKLKSAAALTVPLIMLLVVVGLGVAKAAREVRDVREQTDLATSAIGPSGLVTALQNERNYATMWMLGTEQAVELPVDSIEGSRRATDAAARAFQAEVERKGGDVARIYAPALDALRGLDEVRTAVDNFEGPRILVNSDQVESSWQRYSRLVTDLSDQNSQLTIEVADEELRQGVRLIDMASRELDRIAKVVRVALLAAMTDDGRLRDRDELIEASPLKNEAERWHYAIINHATGRYASLGEELREESDATGALPLANEVITTGNVNVPAILAAISIQDDESYYGFVNDVSEVVRDRAAELNTAARTRQRWYLIVAGLVLGLAGTVAPLVSRSITRPLRSLTRQAKDLAGRRLPAAVRSVLETPQGDDVTVPELQPVEVTAGDEVAEVADTLNMMQTAALDLAVEQAVLRRNVADAFVSLARRNQNLLNRQLDYITELEANETDTTTIANLFRLDHHATRMRRNTESLLVLAGMEPSRRWTAPVPLVNVVRAALGEVEDFQRVDIRRVMPATVVGPAVADLAHLLAELTENALRFSPPTQPVHMQGRPTDDGYVIAISDAGFGMSPTEIAQANRRLAQAEAFTVAPSKYLGHYVAGTLAARHGIAVRLFAQPAGGLTATVHLPSRLLVHDVPASATPPPLAAAPAAPVASAPAATAAGPCPPQTTRAQAGPAGPTWASSTAAGSTGPNGLADRRHLGSEGATRPSVLRRTLTAGPNGTDTGSARHPEAAMPERTHALLADFVAGVERRRREASPAQGGDQ